MRDLAKIEKDRSFAGSLYCPVIPVSLSEVTAVQLKVE